jgi:D-glycero-D-manno-heptose 1,7-bisphosphate phosphatase
MNFLPVVISNQPDISRGITTEREIDQVNDIIFKETGIKHFYICPHDDNDDCECRKPKPGLIKRAELELKLELASSFLVGDRWRDIAAGNSLGISSYFIDYAYTETQPTEPYTKVKSLLEAAKIAIDGGKKCICCSRH